MAEKLVDLLDESRLVILCEHLLHLVLLVPLSLYLALELLNFAAHLLLLSHDLFVKRGKLLAQLFDLLGLLEQFRLSDATLLLDLSLVLELLGAREL